MKEEMVGGLSLPKPALRVAGVAMRSLPDGRIERGKREEEQVGRVRE